MSATAAAGGRVSSPAAARRSERWPPLSFPSSVKRACPWGLYQAVHLGQDLQHPGHDLGVLLGVLVRVPGELGQKLVHAGECLVPLAERQVGQCCRGIHHRTHHRPARARASVSGPYGRHPLPPPPPQPPLPGKRALAPFSMTLAAYAAQTIAIVRRSGGRPRLCAVAFPRSPSVAATPIIR